MIARALSALGLIKRSEHEREIEILKDILEETRAAELLYLNKFKLAATDLAKQAEEIEALRFSLSFACSSADRDDDTIIGLQAEIASLRPDALLWRAAREKRAARKGSVS